MTEHEQHVLTSATDIQSLPPSRWRSFVIVTTSLLIAAALIVGGRVIIKARAESVNGPTPEAPITVSVVPAVLSQGYERHSRHVGLVEPLRQTDLAFETGGTLARVFVDEGELVEKGQLIAQLDTRLLAAERASRVASRTALLSDVERAQLALERQSTLQESDFVAGQSLDDARLLVTRSEALIEQANAAIAAIDVSLDKTTLRAPFKAQVGAQTIDEGSSVNPGTPVARLFEESRPVVRIGLPAESLSALQQHQDHKVKVGGMMYPATVISTRKDLSARTRTADVRLRLDATEHPQPAFGQTAELILQQYVDQPGYQIPVSALTEGDAGLWSLLMFVRDEPGIATGHVVREHIEILHTDGENAFVVGDFLADSAIIQLGPHRVAPGQRVRSTADGL